MEEGSARLEKFYKKENVTVTYNLAQQKTMYSWV